METPRRGEARQDNGTSRVSGARSVPVVTVTGKRHLSGEVDSFSEVIPAGNGGPSTRAGKRLCGFRTTRSSGCSKVRAVTMKIVDDRIRRPTGRVAGSETEVERDTGGLRSNPWPEAPNSVPVAAEFLPRLGVHRLDRLSGSRFARNKPLRARGWVCCGGSGWRSMNPRRLVMGDWRFTRHIGAAAVSIGIGGAPRTAMPILDANGVPTNGEERGS